MIKLRTLFLAFLSLCYLALQAEDSRPNIIVILVDDMGYSDLGCTGSEIKTPNLDTLAGDGVLFTHFYNTARCCPSRAAILTGLHQHQAGIGDMDSPQADYPSYIGHLNESCVTIAEVLGQEGYSTITAGKWHIGSAEPYWPMKRGFQKEYSSPKGGGFFFYPPVGLNRPIYKNGVEQDITDPDWYSTDAFTTESMNFISEAQEEGKPFFLYLAYIAPHYPLQAFPEDMAKYDGVYEVGYETIRAARYAKQKELGVIADDVVLSPSTATSWNSLSDTQKTDRALRMKTYAAMIDRLDWNIGQLAQHLEDLGIDENTALFFVSDNGGASAWHDKKGDGIGTPTSFVSYGESWANVSNTPFRKYKKQTHEGGIISPMIAHWPNGITDKGVVSHEPTHITDMMASCLEIAGVDYPESYNGNSITPMAGESFIPLLNKGKQRQDRVFTWEHEGNRAVRINDWKLVESYNKGWELYNLENDPTELSNLMTQYPDTADMLWMAYQDWAFESGVIEWKVKNPKSHQFDAYNPSTVTEGVEVTKYTNQISIIDPQNEGDIVEYSVPCYIAGNYTLSLSQKSASDRGIYNIYVNDEKVKSDFDAYAASDNTSTLVLTKCDLSSRHLKIKFEYVGMNSKSSDNKFGAINISLKYNGIEGSSDSLIVVNEFPYPAFDGFVVENIADNTYSAPNYGEQLLKVKQNSGSARLSYLFFDLSKIPDNIDKAALKLYYSGTTTGTLPQSTTTFHLYTTIFDLALFGEPSWTTLSPYKDFEKAASFTLSDTDKDSYIEVASEVLAQKLIDAKEDGHDFMGIIIGMDESVSSSTNVLFHNSSNTYSPELILFQNTAIIDHNKESSFSIVPNPASEQILIEGLDNSKQYIITLINSAGQAIYTKRQTPNMPIDIAHLSAGIYIMQIEDTNRKHFQYCMVK